MTFEWTWVDSWIAAVGALSAMACALPGAWLVLRRMSMMGDAISHAVLPGLALAFLLTGSRGSVTMFVGACVAGAATALLVHGVHRVGQVEESAAMGVIFTSLFALGLILIRRAADHVDLDPGCVLYGAIELTPLDTVLILGREIPRAALTNGVVLLVNLVFVIVFYKELKISSFDPALAISLGIRADWMHYLLMIVTALTTVAAFESVGSILVIAMLIVPAATARLLTDRLGVLLVLSVVLAALSAFAGHAAAISAPVWFGFEDTSTSGMMGLMAGVFFTAAYLFAPRQGVAVRGARRLLSNLAIVREDVLGFLYRLREIDPEERVPPSAVTIQRALRQGFLVRIALFWLERGGRLQREGTRWRLTARGETEARTLVRTHRLWESFLVSAVGERPDHVHEAAERLEHVTASGMRASLEQATGSPSEDPHHKRIPQANSE